MSYHVNMLRDERRMFLSNLKSRRKAVLRQIERMEEMDLQWSMAQRHKYQMLKGAEDELRRTIRWFQDLYRPPKARR